MITDLPTSVFKRYHGDKHFSQDGGKTKLAIDMEQNDVTVTLCMLVV